MRKFLPILIVLFLGYVGFSIPFPMFPPMFLDPQKSILPAHVSSMSRFILLGFLLAMYPLGQFFGCPLLGKLSDRYGRRPILIFSLLGIAPTYILSALGVEFKSAFLLFLSRLLCGFLEGNVAIAQASMADMSTQGKDKAKYFGSITIFVSAGFFFGPIIGGKLSDSSLISWFDFSTPFWAASILVFLCFFIVFWTFKETKVKEKELHLEIHRVFFSVFIGIKNKKLRPIFRCNFFLYLSMLFYFAFLPVFLLKQFGFESSELATKQAYLSIPFIVAPLFFDKLSKRFTPFKLLTSTGILFAISLIIVVLPRSSWALWITLLFPSLFAALGFTYSSILVSDHAPKEYQGEMLGINQSLQFLAEIFVGALGGTLAAIMNSLPLFIACFFGCLASLFLIFAADRLSSTNPH